MVRWCEGALPLRCTVAVMRLVDCVVASLLDGVLVLRYVGLVVLCCYDVMRLWWADAMAYLCYIVMLL